MQFLTSVFKPGHFFPPAEGGGLEHDLQILYNYSKQKKSFSEYYLILTFKPCSQVLSQSLQLDHRLHFPLIAGQFEKIQFFDSVPLPTQVVPFPFGVGLLHNLTLVEIPDPQVLLQLDHSVHDDQPPLTKKE